ncbi:MAG: ion channel [Ktedonobacterales bacterium]
MLFLRVVTTIVAVLLIAVVLWDAFETAVLPRRVSRRLRLARVYFRVTWRLWSTVARRVEAIERREAALAVYGPLALLGLLAFWVVLLIVAFALLLWGLGSPLVATGSTSASFGTDLYFSGTTFLTLGLGDVIPQTGPARVVTVVEVGTGFGILALVIGYLPVLYQAFSRREVRISLLDAHAGSPPTPGALFLRHPPSRRARRLTAILAEWENWAAELLETHLSYPILAYYRSQHEDQSWVAALAMILDTCALVLACAQGQFADEELSEQAAFTFAMARHAAVDLVQVFRTSSLGLRPRVASMVGRLPPAERIRLRETLAAVGAAPSGSGEKRDGVESAQGVNSVEIRLDELRALYEPYLDGLAKFLLMALPPWAPEPGAVDDWQTTAEGLTAPSIAELLSRGRTASPEHVR